MVIDLAIEPQVLSVHRRFNARTTVARASRYNGQHHQT
jgi:hypothetical protein